MMPEKSVVATRDSKTRKMFPTIPPENIVPKSELNQLMMMSSTVCMFF